jgi:hypothetical protein
MEDVKFVHSHSNSPLPEAGNDPDDPQRPEIEEENSTPNPPVNAPNQDMEVAEEKAEMPNQDDIQDDVQDDVHDDAVGLSDNESVLSELDDDQFDTFDASNIAIEERPAQVIDDTNVNLIGVHKRKRTEGEGDQPKKKKKRPEKTRRKKNKDDEDDGADQGTAASARGKRGKKSREGKARASPEAEPEENLTPEERAYCASTCYSHTDNNTQAGNAPSTVKSMPSSSRPRPVDARRATLTWMEWLMTRLQLCAPVWHPPQKPTMKVESKANQRATSSDSSPKSLPCSTRTHSRTLLLILRPIYSKPCDSF